MLKCNIVLICEPQQPQGPKLKRPRLYFEEWPSGRYPPPLPCGGSVFGLGGNKPCNF